MTWKDKLRPIIDKLKEWYEAVRLWLEARLGLKEEPVVQIEEYDDEEPPYTAYDLYSMKKDAK